MAFSSSSIFRSPHEDSSPLSLSPKDKLEKNLVGVLRGLDRRTPNPGPEGENPCSGDQSFGSCKFCSEAAVPCLKFNGDAASCIVSGAGFDNPVREIPEDTYLDIQRVPRAYTTAFSMHVKERERERERGVGDGTRREVRLGRTEASRIHVTNHKERRKRNCNLTAKPGQRNQLLCLYHMFKQERRVGAGRVLAVLVIIWLAFLGGVLIS
ncbi:hypothetical protein Cgig2_024902 [Carnegiea gigantea]|uniref:Uncharacterized protein n=1 Tax=Carnegiea gigantea TaxID=171969 RepID=A0A9Q1KD48_9CARY|nr:hypothetical protein Cgig2_024902 [Carnegiea gigantea]